MHYHKFDRSAFFNVLRRKGSFVRHPITDYSCVLIDHKEHIVFIYVLGNHLFVRIWRLCVGVWFMLEALSLVKFGISSDL